MVPEPWVALLLEAHACTRHAPATAQNAGLAPVALSAVRLQVCLMLARGSRGEALDEDTDQIKAVHMKHSDHVVKARPDLSPPLSPTDSASFYSSKYASSLPCTSNCCQPGYAVRT